MPDPLSLRDDVTDRVGLGDAVSEGLVVCEAVGEEDKDTLPLGEEDRDTLSLGDGDSDGLSLGDGDTEGLSEGDGDPLGDSVTDGDRDGVLDPLELVGGERDADRVAVGVRVLEGVSLGDAHRPLLSMAMEALSMPTDPLVRFTVKSHAMVTLTWGHVGVEGGERLWHACGVTVLGQGRGARAMGGTPDANTES